MKKEKILVWLSWGVDSAVAAALLLESGYEVVGGFMKNYVSDKGNCTTYKDAEEAIKVANHLWIELLSFDLQSEYQERIIDYIFAGYEKGITPNPDVLCNSLIKFDVFLQKALALGFDKIATGHYARITTPIIGLPWQGEVVPQYCGAGGVWGGKGGFVLERGFSPKRGFLLKRGVDHHKDQSYFLAGLNQFQLSHSLFPLGELTKPQVRALAKKFWLPNAERKDSQGLCFIGNIPIREFLLQRFPKKEGDIITLEGKVVGKHPGAYFYTIGQKQGLGLNFKAYVYRIDIEQNILYVTDKDSEALQTKTLIAKDWHRISPNIVPNIICPNRSWTRSNSVITGKIRYRQNPPVPCHLEALPDNAMKVTFTTPQRAVAPGQIFVAYDGEICLGCGTIA